MALDTIIAPHYGGHLTGREASALFAYQLEFFNYEVPSLIPGKAPLLPGGTDKLAGQIFERTLGPAIRSGVGTYLSTTEELIAAEGTVALWFKLKTLPAGGGTAYIQYALAGTSRYNIEIPKDGSGSLHTRWGNLGVARDTGIVLKTDRWYRIVVVWETRGSTTVSAYLDRELVDEYTTFIGDDAAPRIMDGIDGDAAEYIGMTCHCLLPLIQRDYQRYAARLDYDVDDRRFRVSSSEEGGVIGRLLSNTPWKNVDVLGRFKVVDAPELARGRKAIECFADGALFVHRSAYNVSARDMAYGTWHYCLQRGIGIAPTDIVIASVPASVTDPLQNGYRFTITNLNVALFYRITAGVSTVIFRTDFEVVPDTSWHEVKITRRSSDGQWYIAIDDQLLPPGIGYTNPFDDDVHQVGEYQVLASDAGDKFANVHRHFGDWR